jgi:hypothetical protein
MIFSVQSPKLREFELHKNNYVVTKYNNDIFESTYLKCIVSTDGQHPVSLYRLGTR